LVSTQEGRQRDEALPKDEAEAASSSWLHMWEGSVTQRGGMVMSVKGEMISGMGKGGDDTRWTDANLIGQKKNQRD
jgi:hypothetical protein